MLDVAARELAGRLATWQTDQGELTLPAVAHVHTEKRPAPAFAELALSRSHHPELPTIVVQGTIFTPTPSKDPEENTLPRGLVYPAAAGSSLQEAADDLMAPDTAFQMVNRPEALGDHEGLAVLVGARFVSEDPWRLPDTLVSARTHAGPNPVLFLPGLGRPDQMAVAVYAGVDILDGLVPVLAGLRGRFLTPEGPEAPPEPGSSPCACPACEGAQGAWTRDLLVAHNQWACQAELYRIRRAIAEGRLRELVEARAHTSPEQVAMLRRLDADHAGFFEARAPSLRQRPLPVVSRESLARPEITRWVDHLGSRYTPPEMARVLVVLPCSKTKPYENSPTHQRIRPRINKHSRGRTHVVTLTSPIGAVPEELEHAYPAAHYDIPVTGTWYPEERALVERAFRSIKEAGAYEHVILHLPPEEVELVDGIFPEADVTVPEGTSPTHPRALDRLEKAVDKSTAGTEAVRRTLLFREHMRSRADWQFGPGVGDVLLAGTEIKGKYPFLKIIADGNEQVAMLQPQRGNLTLTEEGGRRLAQATEAYLVEIDDFHPKGTVFAPGVHRGAPGIRVEDEVALVHEGDYRGTGRALAPGPEMGPMRSGGCVEVRHHA